MPYIIGAVLGALAATHEHTVMAGRTHGQHALPMTFGFKVAGWIDELDRDRDRLQQRAATSSAASARSSRRARRNSRTS